MTTSFRMVAAGRSVVVERGFGCFEVVVDGEGFATTTC